MPLYDYRCEEDGSVITLLRPMRDADKPVEDPDGKDRVFKRVFSTFAVGESATGRSTLTSEFPTCPTCCGDGACGL